MKYYVTSTIAGGSSTFEFATIELAADYAREIAVAAFESGCAEDFSLDFNTDEEEVDA